MSIRRMAAFWLIAVFVIAACSSGGASQAPASEAPASEAPASEAPASEAPASQAPAAGGNMGGGMPAQNQMPMGQMPQQPMPMCSMMQNMMRMGAAQQAMPTMQGGASPGANMSMGMGAMADGAQPMGSSAARLEGRIAFLRTELHISDAQAPAWESFASTLRTGRDHLDAARAALQDGTMAIDPMARLESYENHLKARTEAVHMTRTAFNTLFGQLDDAQKRMATTSMLPFIGSF